MIASSWHIVLGECLGTYVVHSTALLLLTWATFKVWRTAPDRVRETSWRFALFAGFFTTWLQISLLRNGVEPLGGAFELSWALPEAAEPVGGHEASPPADPTDPGEVLFREGADEQSQPWAWTWLSQLLLPSLVWCYLGCIASLIVVHLVRWFRFHQSLGDRIRVQHGPLYERFRDLRCAAGLPRRTRLSVAAAVRCPMAFGVLRPEVCLPASLLADMPAEQQGCVVAHELGHLRDRDPFWQLLQGVARWLGFCQPLNRLAHRELHELAEYRCDRWAVRRAGSQVNMAKALMTVAESLVGKPDAVRPLALPGVSAMAVHGSALGRRVERILGDGASDNSSSTHLAVVLALATALSGVAATVPGLSLSGADQEPLIQEPLLQPPFLPEPDQPQLENTQLENTRRENTRRQIQSGREPDLGRRKKQPPSHGQHHGNRTGNSNRTSATLARLEVDLAEIQSQFDGLMSVLKTNDHNGELQAMAHKIRSRIGRLQNRRRSLWRQLQRTTEQRPKRTRDRRDSPHTNNKRRRNK